VSKIRTSYCVHSIIDAALYMRLEILQPPAISRGLVSLVAFLATFCRQPARPSFNLEREAKPPRRRNQLTRPKSPLLKIVNNSLHQKGGLSVLHLQFILFYRNKNFYHKILIPHHIYIILLGKLIANVITNLELR
jgi:hypothetical protein